MTSKSYNEVKEQIEQMKALSESHPYGEMFLNRVDLYLGNESAIESSKSLSEKYPQDLALKFGYAEQLFDKKCYDDVIKICEEILTVEENYISAKYLLANSLVEKQEYQKAIDMLFDVIDGMGGNFRKIYDIHEKIAEISRLAIVKYEEIYANDPEDYQNMYDLIWTYGELMQYDKVEEYLNKLPQGKPSEYE